MSSAFDDFEIGRKVKQNFIDLKGVWMELPDCQFTKMTKNNRMGRNVTQSTVNI
jgi:hypothetical protein